MARLRLASLVLVVLAVALPGNAATESQTVGCSGPIKDGGAASCVTSFAVPHFKATDSIDYETLVARIVSPQARNWKVHGKIQDARGKVYFAWECTAARSTVGAGSSAYVEHSCAAWRKLVKVKKRGQTSYDYYKADTSKAQVLTVTARVGACAPSVTSGCRFEAEATYLFSG